MHFTVAPCPVPLLSLLPTLCLGVEESWPGPAYSGLCSVPAARAGWIVLHEENRPGRGNGIKTTDIRGNAAGPGGGREKEGLEQRG